MTWELWRVWNGNLLARRSVQQRTPRHTVLVTQGPPSKGGPSVDGPGTPPEWSHDDSTRMVCDDSIRGMNKGVLSCSRLSLSQRWLKPLSRCGSTPGASLCWLWWHISQETPCGLFHPHGWPVEPWLCAAYSWNSFGRRKGEEV